MERVRVEQCCICGSFYMERDHNDFLLEYCSFCKTEAIRELQELQERMIGQDT